MSDRPTADSSGRSRPTFEVTHREEPSDVLLVGFTQYGLAGLTAVNFLVENLDLEQTGHVTVDELPAVTPFEDGTPRHHTRFFSRPDLDVTILVGELFVPQFAAEGFSNALFDWFDRNDVSEVAVLSGVPVPHGPDEHRTFFVATRDYQETRLADRDVPAMGNGFLDGVNASLLSHGIDSPFAACVYVTPVHAQGPDVEAAIRLTETVRDVYDLPVDIEPLEAYAEEVSQYYEELSERLAAVAEEQRSDDRMYM